MPTVGVPPVVLLALGWVVEGGVLLAMLLTCCEFLCRV